MQRFNEPKSGLFSFTDEILVVCPVCDSCARVVKDHPQTWLSTRRLLCGNCGHTEVGRKERYTVYVKRYCPQCGKVISKTLTGMTEPKASLKIRCSHCTYSDTYTTTTAREHTICSAEPCDGYYHLPLWFSEPFKDQYIWAYNRQHLAFLIRYVSADLRDKPADNRAKSLEQKLPKWMKLAKNRDGILKALKRLQRK